MERRRLRMVIRTMLRARKARPNRSQRRLSRRCRSFLCPGRGAGAPTGAPAAPYGQGGAPYGGAPTAAYGESLAGPQGGAEPYGYQAAPYGQEPGAYGQSGAGSPTFSSARFSPHIAEAKHFSSRCFVSHNKHTARQLFLQKLPGGMFLFMTIECSQSVHSIVSSIHKSS